MTEDSIQDKCRLKISLIKVQGIFLLVSVYKLTTVE